LRHQLLEQQALAPQVEHPQAWLGRRQRVIDHGQVVEAIEQALAPRALGSACGQAEDVGIRGWSDRTELVAERGRGMGDRHRGRQATAEAQRQDGREAAAQAPSHVSVGLLVGMAARGRRDPSDRAQCSEFRQGRR
jgi:hypothetical protein